VQSSKKNLVAPQSRSAGYVICTHIIYTLAVGLDRYRYRVSGDTFLSIAADTGLASVGHGAISRRDRYRAETVCGRASDATGSMRVDFVGWRQLSQACTCSDHG
jgi:pyrrolidone-carboxylate peptidase